MSDQYHHGVRVIEVDSGVRPIRSVQTGIIGVVGTAPDADDNAFPLNTPVLVAGSRTQAAKLDTTGQGLGTLPQVMDAIFDQIAPLMVVVRVPEAEDENEQIGHIKGTVDASGRYTGLQALLAAQAQVGVKPRILGAPGFSHHQAIAGELGSLAEKLRAFAYADLAVNSTEEALAARKQLGHRRLMLLWPGVKAWSHNATVVQPASARALGLRAKLDNDVGWHKVISNQVIHGVTGLSCDVDWDLQNPNTAAGVLNEKAITTLIQQDGFRFWGSRTCSSDPRFAFESAVRTNDVLADTIANAHLWAVDKPLSPVLIDDIVGGVNAKFRQLKAAGYIINGNCYPDPALNTTTALSAGKLHLNYDFTPVPPLEQLQFRTCITDQYLIELLPKAA